MPSRKLCCLNMGRVPRPTRFIATPHEPPASCGTRLKLPDLDDANTVQVPLRYVGGDETLHRLPLSNARIFQEVFRHRHTRRRPRAIAEAAGKDDEFAPAVKRREWISHLEQQ